LNKDDILTKSVVVVFVFISTTGYYDIFCYWKII